MSANPRLSLADLITSVPIVADAARAVREWETLSILSVTDPSLAPLHAELGRPSVKNLLTGIFSGSPYLTRLIVRYPQYLMRCLVTAPDELGVALARELTSAIGSSTSRAASMRAVRHYKTQIAMLIACADIGGVWSVMTVTRKLSEAADAAVQASVSALFVEAQRREEWLDIDPGSADRAGYFVVAMGKLGAYELNYSSDIDLMVFYDPHKNRLAPSREMQTFFVRMTRDLVSLLQQPTEDGYVFRTDLRLRPDPGSTPVALSVSAAYNYYESVGQNWERAALIKARVIAGDFIAGNKFLAELSPFVWRKNLDFAAIADIHAMKRQIHAVKGFGTIAVAGHNIKVGRGGIREIEFFAQTQQLIAGGRQFDLRVSDTLGALDRLATRGWIAVDVRDDLAKAYRYLRRIEHFLQMIADEQTQTLPQQPDALASLAAFAGYTTYEAFAADLTLHLATVQRHYSQLFESSPALTATGQNMVFAGARDDPATLSALSVMGFSDPASVVERVRGWHHGRVRAVRQPRARELLTEVQPRLIEAFAATSNPDQAIAGFDRFLTALPSGVQLFSLLKQHPALLDLLAAIMGTAPRLAKTLSHRSHVLDAVLDPGFFGSLASPSAIRHILEPKLSEPLRIEQILDHTRVVGSEQAFLIGVRVLTGTISAADAGKAYASLADELIKVLINSVAREMQRLHGHVQGGGVAVVALGKLGGREMTAASDLDLIVVYDFDPAILMSTGLKPLPPAQYYARWTQRLIAAFNAPTAEGALYDIDLRLRPSGHQGPVATQLSSFVAYQATEAWTWEHMALTRARVVAASPGLRERVEAAIFNVICKPRNVPRIAGDVRDMRARIAGVKGTSDVWDLKHVPGGLVDLEFIAQCLQLVHAASHPDIVSSNTASALTNLASKGILSPSHSSILLAAVRRLNNLTQVLRLSLIEGFDLSSMPDGLKRLLAQVADAPTFDILTADLRVQHHKVAVLFDAIINQLSATDR